MVAFPLSLILSLNWSHSNRVPKNDSLNGFTNNIKVIQIWIKFY